jgi:DNA-binding protein YbaB
MAREIDEAFVEEAVERYQRIDAALAEVEKAMAHTEATVTSADGLVRVVVAATGEIRDVQITGSLTGRGRVEVARSVREAVLAAADAAAWARGTVQAEMLHRYPALADCRPVGRRDGDR